MDLGNIYMVQVTVERDYIELPFVSKIVNEFLNQNSELFDEYDVYLVPESIREEFDQFERSVGEDLRKASAKHPVESEEPMWLIMTERMLEDYLERFKSYQEEYHRMRDRVVSQYEKMIDDFIFSLARATSKEADLYREQLEKSIPSKEEFEASFKISFDKMKLGENSIPEDSIMEQLLALQK